MSLKPCSNAFVWVFQSPKLMSPSLRTTPGKRWTLIATLTSRKLSEGWNQNTYDLLLIFSWYSLYLIYDFQTYVVFSLSTHWLNKTCNHYRLSRKHSSACSYLLFCYNSLPHPMCQKREYWVCSFAQWRQKQIERCGGRGRVGGGELDLTSEILTSDKKG